MMETLSKQQSNERPILVIGGTGKTGSRVMAGLKERGVATRLGSRSASPAFEWNNEASWGPALKGARAAYISYASDLAVPGATDTIRAFVAEAVKQGLEHLVILSGRGESEAQACERIVQNSGIDWTVVRASWFNQNFSEGAFIDMVNDGVIALPAGDVPEPFVDVNDIAEVAVTALTEPGHAGEIYEVTGPRSMTFADIAKDLSEATGKQVVYHPLTHDEFVKGVRDSGAPESVVWMMDYLFSTVLDGRNSNLCDGVQRALGRDPKDFREYAMEVAKSGAWRVAA